MSCQDAEPKKMGRPPTTGTGHPVLVSFLPDLLEALDESRESQSPVINRGAAVQCIVAADLSRCGYLRAVKK
jgi:hypothetical protein